MAISAGWKRYGSLRSESSIGWHCGGTVAVALPRSLKILIPPVRSPRSGEHLAAFSNGRMPLLNAGVRGAPADHEIAAAIVRDAITRDRTSPRGRSG
jgi:hypothetical protein